MTRRLARPEHEKKSTCGLTRILKAVNEYSGALLAAFTALLFVATVLLWWATRDLVEGAKDTAESELRAYVIPTKGDVRNFGTSAPLEASIRIRNAGQTPAYRITTSIDLRLGEDFTPQPVDLSPDVLGPGSETNLLFVASRLLTPEEESKIKEGNLTIYVFGEIRYRDIFRIEHVTKYRRMTRTRSGALQGTGDILDLYNAKEGNDSN